MQFKEDCTVSAGLLKQAVPMMVERQIPPTPNNYALWYAHASDDYPTLSDALLDTFPGAGSYDSEKSEALFFEHFIKHHLPQSEEAQNTLAALLSQMFSAASKTADGTQAYGDSLQEAMATLRSSSDQDEIESTLSQVLAQTEDVENLSRSFQSELNQAKQEVEALKTALEASRQDALIDELTQIGNRRAFDQAIEKALADGSNQSHLLLMDLDHFKQCNDTYGHVMGDRVLERMGAILKAVASANVQVMRYGGEEFAAIVSGQQADALEVAEGIRRKVSGIRITQAGSSNALDTLSISVGVATAAEAEDASQLKVRADEALYQAKERGRNRVCVSEGDMALTG